MDDVTAERVPRGRAVAAPGGRQARSAARP